MISECEGEKGNFLCGPEWRVKITTRADQRLEVQQVGREEGDTAPATVVTCAVKCNIGFTIGFHNHREGPY